MKRMAMMLVLGAALISPGSLDAQVAVERSVEAELRSMLAAERVPSDHDVILDFLSKDHVVEVASAEGIDMDEVEDQVQAMDDAAAADLADRVRSIQDAMVGGDTFVIGSTTLIIILLVLILLTD